MSLDLDPDRLTRNPFIVGALGSFVALRFAPGLTWAERVFNVACGAICSGFCAPALTEWMQVTSPGMQSFCAFSVGMFGLSLAAAITGGLRATDMAAILKGWLSKPGA